MAMSPHTTLVSVGSMYPLLMRFQVINKKRCPRRSDKPPKPRIIQKGDAPHAFTTDVNAADASDGRTCCVPLKADRRGETTPFAAR